MDFPAGRNSYTDRETDMAGRFPTSKNQSIGGSTGALTGMSTDERLPMQREEERRRARELADEVDQFFQQRPEEQWDFAAGPELNNAVVELLSPGGRERRSVAKSLVNQRVDEVRAHFAVL